MIQLTGHITRIIYRGKGDYAIARFRQDRMDEITAVGSINGLEENEPLLLHGDWQEKEYNGKVENQFKVVAAFRKQPDDLPSLELFLANAVAGCGPTRAALMVKKHGQALFGILKERRADKLIEVVGIGMATAERILNSYQAKSLGYHIAAFLCSIGVNPEKTDKIQRGLGPDAIRLIQKNPYRLTRVQGIGFKTADRIAQKMGWTLDSPERAEATLFYTLEESSNAGHSYLPRTLLISEAIGHMVKKEAPEEGETPVAPSVELTEEQLTAILNTALDSCYTKKHLVKETANTQAGPVEMAYLPFLYNAETRLARKLRILLSTKPACRHSVKELCYFIQESEKALGLTLTDEQSLAVVRAFTEPISILTGGPGTGKTATQRVLVDVSKRLGYDISLCAPTGRAAKHLSGVTGDTALTIHRLLKYDPEGDGWLANESNPLETDMVISDEFSMVDIDLAYRVADAIRPGTPWLLIGDKDQLPAVSPGRVLEDLISSERIVTTTLTKIFRQAASSKIIQNAHRILKGETLQFPDKKDGVVLSDCYLMEPPLIPSVDEKGNRKKNSKGKPAFIEDYEWIKTVIFRMCKARLPERIKPFNPIRDVQVLTPMKERGLGVHVLNETLQDALNPVREGVEEVIIGLRRFRTGDRVQQYRNNYQLGEEDPQGKKQEMGVYNGDLGFITAIDTVEQELRINFGGENDVKYPFEDAKQDLHLGYAMSIHKSQGGEFPVVILVLTKANWKMLQRNLLYTAFTRAQKMLVLMALKWSVKQAVDTVEIQQRYSFLKTRLHRELAAQKAA
jgi:exodeoxyribonuclease V alpha subunit